MAFEDEAADILAAAIDEISLHTADPTTVGDNEISDVAYARLTPTYASAVGGVAELSAALEFNGPALGGPVTHIGFWSAGTFLRGTAVATAESFSPIGRLDLTSAPVTASEPGA